MANSPATNPDTLSRNVFLYLAMGGVAFLGAIAVVMLFMK